MDGRGKGSKKDSAAAAAAAAAKPAPTLHGRGGRDAKESSPSRSLGAGPAKNQASLLNEGQESDSRGRNTSPKRKEGALQTGGSDQAGQRMESKEKKPAAASKKVQAAGARKAEGPGQVRTEAACCWKSEKESDRAGEGRKASRKSKGVASHTGESGEEEPTEKKLAAPPQAPRECPLKADEPEQARVDAAAAAQKKRASRKAKGAPKEAPDQKSIWSLRKVLETITLRQAAVSKASERVNKVMDLLIAAIKKDPRFSSIDKLGTGSYYEHLKISKPDEFDIMLKLPQLRFELESCDASSSTGAFYYVKLKRCPGKLSLRGFLDNERLSADKMLRALRDIIIEEVKKIEEEKVSVERKKPRCPAVTLLIGEPPSVIAVDIVLALEGGRQNQCDSTKNGLTIEKWLGTKVKTDFRNEPLILVPKKVKDGKNLKDCWRLSFSHIEKKIIKHHGREKTCCESGGTKCCRKACLKLLKYLLELLKTKHENRNQFDKFCSYHAKTAFFQACVKWPSDGEWLETNLDDCFEKFLDFFLDCLRNAELRHFFIPEFNFFSTDIIEKAKCKILAKVIESERNNRFPIFSLEL